MCEGGRLYKKSKGGLSNAFYKLLSQTPHEEIRAGNLTRCLNRGILNAISCDVRKTLTFHDNVVLEVLLTQKIMRECDTAFVNFSGYIQHFQADPFATHMYNETGVGILVAHMRKKPVKLYLDATGSVVSKIPDQKKRVLYYALVLAGHGRGAPPLPVAEMLTNNHTVPSISHWLLQFLHTRDSRSVVRELPPGGAREEKCNGGLKKTAAVFFFFFSSAAVRRDRLWVGLEGFGGEGGRRLRPLALQRPPAPTSPLPGAVDAVSRCAFLPPHGGWGRGPLAPGVTVDRDGLSSVRPNRVASFRAGIRLTYNWRKGSAAMSATHPTRLETRTKESNARASQRVLRNPAAQ
ncbi:hypothetical protein N1851_009446 [Merluccius polli]|uniref:Uncharacterized protein n=1 Tax=Merluccius polli TaxID=89951 RepID=A0AA47N127_MERPO|nr:hypothetical protein N1851_009446 [Merluccius polli]